MFPCTKSLLSTHGARSAHFHALQATLANISYRLALWTYIWDASNGSNHEDFGQEDGGDDDEEVKNIAIHSDVH